MTIKSTALTDYPTISSLAHESREPIYVTRDGEDDIVVMSVEAYEREQQLFKLNAELERREREYLSGARTYSIEEVREKLEKLYNNEKA